MASPFVLSNYALQFLQTQVRTRYALYMAVHQPVAYQVQSQDVALDTYGQYTVIPNVDLLAQAQAPFTPQPNSGPNRITFVGSRCSSTARARPRAATCPV